MKIILHILLQTLAVFVAGVVLQAGVVVPNVQTALIVAIVLGLVNFFIRPVIVFLTLPITFITLGLFYLVINAALVLLVTKIVPGFTVKGFWWALLFSVLVSIVGSFLSEMQKHN